MINQLTERRINQCNELFDRELGEGLFRWKWARNLEISVQKINPDDGAPVFENSLPDPVTGLIEVRPVYFRRKVLGPEFMNSWVICQFIPPITEYRHRQMFGSKMEWQRNGLWNPIKDSTLKDGLLPSIEATEWGIAGIKAHRLEEDGKVDAALKQQAIDAAATARARKDEFKDAFAFNFGIPGKKLNYSFGGVESPETAHEA